VIEGFARIIAMGNIATSLREVLAAELRFFRKLTLPLAFD